MVGRPCAAIMTTRSHRTVCLPSSPSPPPFILPPEYVPQQANVAGSSCMFQISIIYISPGTHSLPHSPPHYRSLSLRRPRVIFSQVFYLENPCLSPCVCIRPWQVRSQPVSSERNRRRLFTEDRALSQPIFLPLLQMLQYPLPLPPLSLTSSRKSKDQSGNRSNDASVPLPLPPLPSTLNNRRPTTDTRSPSSFLSAFAAHSHPHAFSISPSTYKTPLPSPSPAPSNPVSFPSPSSAHPWRPPNLSANEIAEASRRSSTASEVMGDILSPGDLVGEGVPLQGENIRLVSMPDTVDYEAPAQEFQVVRRLGTGSYAVVYLVREVLSRPSYSHDSHMSLDGMELDDKVSRRQSIEYGRDFAIKCLSKANLDEDALKAQMSEVCILF